MTGESEGRMPPIRMVDELGTVSRHLLAWAEVVRMASEDGCNAEEVGMLVHDGLRAERAVVERIRDDVYGALRDRRAACAGGTGGMA